MNITQKGNQLKNILSTDSGIGQTIAGREKARNKKREVKVKKRSRSRPRKDEVREPKEMKRVERANSHLKDHLLPCAPYVKGHAKVSFIHP
jgi:hypothetical protein